MAGTECLLGGAAIEGWPAAERQDMTMALRKES